MTKEIIDEVSVLYQEDPIYQVVDEKGKSNAKDQKLWEEIMRHSRYKMIMDKLDRWTRLLGTVLVKVSFIDPDTGKLVEANKGGEVQLDLMHGGIYDLRHGASPYYISELLIGFGTKFAGFKEEAGMSMTGVNSTVPSPSNLGVVDATNTSRANKKDITDYRQLGKINRIYWSPNSHRQIDEDNNEYKVDNPYGIVPAVPFFNQDPAHYYFLPINEPLLYANHALNMRMTDLNHIAKFQSFGVPVLRGVERPNSTRQGRPVDDFNQLRGGSAQTRFGGLTAGSGLGVGGFRNFDAGFGIHRDGNADANALGFSLGPDTAVAVGEKGDFKFAHPSADITGLVKTIHSITDMVRINHGLRPKYEQTLPSSGFSLLMEKIGVLDNNIRRSKLFKDREQQLFQVIKTLWNTHHAKSGDRKFSADARLEVTYKTPEFPVDPKTKKEDVIMEQKIIASGDRHAIKKLYPYLSDSEISKLITKNRSDIEEQAIFLTELEVKKALMMQEAGIANFSDSSKESIGNSSKSMSSNIAMTGAGGDGAETKPKIDNRAKHAEASSKQPKKNGDPRSKDKKE